MAGDATKDPARGGVGWVSESSAVSAIRVRAVLGWAWLEESRSRTVARDCKAPPKGGAFLVCGAAMSEVSAFNSVSPCASSLGQKPMETTRATTGHCLKKGAAVGDTGRAVRNGIERLVFELQPANADQPEDC